MLPTLWKSLIKQGFKDEGVKYSVKKSSGKKQSRDGQNDSSLGMQNRQNVADERKAIVTGF